MRIERFNNTRIDRKKMIIIHDNTHRVFQSLNDSRYSIEEFIIVVINNQHDFFFKFRDIESRNYCKTFQLSVFRPKNQFGRWRWCLSNNESWKKQKHIFFYITNIDKNDNKSLLFHFSMILNESFNHSSIF